MGVNTALFKTDMVNGAALRTAEWAEPERIYRAMAGRPGFVWLDSAADQGGLGRWSFMMWNPRSVISGGMGAFLQTSGDGSSRRIANPLSAIGDILSQNAVSHLEKAPPFTGGVAGFFGYGLLRLTEPSARLAQRPAAPEGDLWLGVFDSVIAFDHHKGEMILTAHKGAGNQESALDRMEEEIARAINSSSCMEASSSGLGSAAVASNFTRESYTAAVERARGYIERGDIYQVNLAQRFTAEDKYGDALYLRLRAINPAPFAGYINSGPAQILSASPERFIHLSRGEAQTRPIKGTRPRGRNAREDYFLKMELLNSEKDHAENVMIVDLLRNDFSKVCRPNSVSAPRICQLETHPTVFHLVSTVAGRLRPECAALDLFMNAFPGGSITGAPKIRAMEIIDELEPHPRGAYCGAMGYIGFNGDMDLNIIIRTIIRAGGKISFHAGGGITWSSNPEEEYQETLDKASALIKAAS